MSGTVADRKRLLRVTAGNLRNSHLGPLKISNSRAPFE